MFQGWPRAPREKRRLLTTGENELERKSPVVRNHQKRREESWLSSQPLSGFFFLIFWWFSSLARESRVVTGYLSLPHRFLYLFLWMWKCLRNPDHRSPVLALIYILFLFFGVFIQRFTSYFFYYPLDEISNQEKEPRGCQWRAVASSSTRLIPSYGRVLKAWKYYPTIGKGISPGLWRKRLARSSSRERKPHLGW